METTVLKESESWPYPARTYVKRILWACVWHTVWKLAWRRVPTLRPLLLRAFGADVGLRSGFDGSTRIEMQWLLRVGNHCSIGPRVTIYNLGSVCVGDNTVISQDAYLCAGTHDYTVPGYPLKRTKITVGNWVWIAAGAFIGPGVTVGDGAVAGARAVVTKDVPPWTVVAGNPARPIKKRELKGIAPQ
jgi:putative colanic acid biosynthesis acetyltransferase WcaF